MYKLILSFMLSFMLAACAGRQAASVTTIGPRLRHAATGSCSTDADVLIGFRRGHMFAEKLRGISIGDGYVITDAHAPIDASRMTALMMRGKPRKLVETPIVVVRVDEGADIALLRIGGEPACDAVLADMRRVHTKDEVHSSSVKNEEPDAIIEPRERDQKFGASNAAMSLSYGMHDVPAGAGIYAANGTLVGMRVTDLANTARVVALPADRIARFLRAQHVPYMQYDPTRQDDAVVITVKR